MNQLQKCFISLIYGFIRTQIYFNTVLPVLDVQILLKLSVMTYLCDVCVLFKH